MQTTDYIFREYYTYDQNGMHHDNDRSDNDVNKYIANLKKGKNVNVYIQSQTILPGHKYIIYQIRVTELPISTEPIISTEQS